MLLHDVRSKLVGPLAPGVHAACDGHIFRFVLQWNHIAYLKLTWYVQSSVLQFVLRLDLLHGIVLMKHPSSSMPSLHHSHLSHHSPLVLDVVFSFPTFV
jgi:hypothetical protein